jgi:NTP pyrophosphatase (non-canonical NTP hydrolase)
MTLTEEINKKNSQMYGPMHEKCEQYAKWCRCFNNNEYNNKNMIDLVNNVIAWADDKDLLKPENSLKQFTKVVEEVGEVAAALARNDKDELKDGIGDVIVTLIILAEQQGLAVGDCLQAAWDEIKNRKGKTVNGTFIKSEDLK